jgi:hypothetical protein
VRTSYYLFAQKPGKELEDYQRWLTQTHPDKNDHLFYANGYNTEGGGENLVWSAADFENFLEPRPDMPAQMESELEPVLRLLVKNRWPFRIHATYGESIDRDLAVIEKVNKDTPLNGLRWFFDHAETITDGQLARVKALGGGIAVQDRMYFQGELYWKRYGEQTRQMPPIKKMLAMKIPVGLGTDGTRVSSYGPWPSIYWAVTGKTAGGLKIWQDKDVLSRYQALKLMTQGSAWMSGEEKAERHAGQGQYADLVILPQDYFTMDVEKIKNLEASLTIVNGKVVYAAPEYQQYAPAKLEVRRTGAPSNTTAATRTSNQPTNQPTSAPAASSHSRWMRVRQISRPATPDTSHSGQSVAGVPSPLARITPTDTIRPTTTGAMPCLKARTPSSSRFWWPQRAASRSGWCLESGCPAWSRPRRPAPARSCRRSGRHSSPSAPRTARSARRRLGNGDGVVELRLRQPLVFDHQVAVHLGRGGNRAADRHQRQQHVMPNRLSQSLKLRTMCKGASFMTCSLQLAVGERVAEAAEDQQRVGQRQLQHQHEHHAQQRNQAVSQRGSGCVRSADASLRPVAAIMPAVTAAMPRSALTPDGCRTARTAGQASTTSSTHSMPASAVSAPRRPK